MSIQQGNIIKHAKVLQPSHDEIEQIEKDHWDIEIEPKSSALNIPIKEIWRYRDLLFLFVKRDFVAQYKQTILGPLWHLIQPIFTTLMFLLIFGRIARIPTDNIHPTVFYMSGIAIWNYFSACLTNTANTFVGNANIFGKVYFPRLILPLSVIFSNMVRLGIQFGLLLIVMIWYHFHGYPIQVSINWIFIPFLVIVMAGIGLGLGIIISSITTRYRDFSVLLTFAVQLGMYATPVAYPISYLKNGTLFDLISMNPLAPIVEAFRYCIFGYGTFTPGTILYSVGFMLTTLLVGTLIFNKVEKNFMDTV